MTTAESKAMAVLPQQRAITATRGAVMFIRRDAGEHAKFPREKQAFRNASTTKARGQGSHFGRNWNAPASATRSAGRGTPARSIFASGSSDAGPALRSG